MPTEREYFEKFREGSFAHAKERGCEIVIASSSQIQLDIDKPWPSWVIAKGEQDETMMVLDVLAATAGERIRNVLTMLLQFFVVLKWEAWPSTSGNTHIMLTFSREFEPTEKIAIQAILGSDPMRELLNLRKVWCQAEDPIALFRPAK